MSRTMLAILITVFLALLGLVAPAKAAGAWKSVASWPIKYSDEACYTMADFSNDAAFGFAVSKTGEFRLLVNRNAWAISETGGDQKVVARIDATPASQHTGRVFNGTLLLIDVEMSERSLDALSRGKILRLVIGTQTLGFELTGTKAMLPELVRCAMALRDSRPS